ncbi:hypothetical protein PGT21_001038 [Puccinia graminis f. sp. tritici]|uniref:Uncharacterized protein n=1 Tax=Puccinia graminis f. sp. tritici TaxID=56615 RepID=A0A5B0MYS5_PUCGR|nr:hypothetical protein PGT21_001038 [Puccinia graminis f. sp. tritici]
MPEVFLVVSELDLVNSAVIIEIFDVGNTTYILPLLARLPKNRIVLTYLPYLYLSSHLAYPAYMHPLLLVGGASAPLYPLATVPVKLPHHHFKVLALKTYRNGLLLSSYILPHSSSTPTPLGSRVKDHNLDNPLSIKSLMMFILMNILFTKFTPH